MHETPLGAGKGSFDLIDSEKLFSVLGLEEGVTLLDVGCGSGDYTIAAAERIGEKGMIYAIDAWEEGVDELIRRAAIKGITNIRASVVDASEGIPIEDQSVDICLMATVLHDLIREGVEKGALQEIKRALKPMGRLVVIEFKKIEGPPGPPREVRISPEELERLLTPYGFCISRSTEIGAYNYVSIFINHTNT